MTHFLKSDVKPDGFRLEDILGIIRNDVIHRTTKIMEDHRTEAQHVLRNNIKILEHLSQAILLAEDSTRTLDKAFGPHADSGSPRIGAS